MYLKRILFGLVSAALCFSSFGQEIPSFTVRRAVDPIRLDGLLDEESWKQAEVTSELIQQFPYDTSRSVLKTEFRVTYDEEFIYVSAVSYDNRKGRYVVSSLRRDFRGPGLDGVSVIFDTFQDVTNAFFFGLSPAGVQREGLISNGWVNREDMDLSCDNKWYSSTKINEQSWVAEFAIPFKTLRFKSGQEKWNVKFYRQDSKENERAIWPFTPRNFEPGNLHYHGEMIWDQPTGDPGSNISLIPYSAAKGSRDFIAEKPFEPEFSTGGDAKVAVTPSLNLDLTFNPDFSQVEVDQQVTNLERFEIFFPERRQFFLENADLFSSFGHIYTRPFFSRRIGVSRDAKTGQNVQNRILYGARLSGNINKHYRIGFLNMQTGEVKESAIPSYNYTVTTVQRRLGSNSNLRGIFVNRQEFRDGKDQFKFTGFNYNRVAGLDYNFRYRGNRWTGNAFYHKLITQEKSEGQFSSGYSLVYSTQRTNINWYHQRIGKGYDPAVGYTPRNGFNRISPSGNFSFYPQSKVINAHGPIFDLAYIWDDVYGLTDYEHSISYGIRFQSQAQISAGFKETYIYLFRDFDPANSPTALAIPKLAAGTDYRYGVFTMNLVTDPRRLLTAEMSAVSGSYFNGSIRGLRGTLNYRWQPYGVFSLNTSINRIKLPSPYANTTILLIGPRFDLTLSRNVFFTTFIQYNSQYTNLNINTRFQWRFRPVSDLFLVYTDNYYYSFDQPDQNFAPRVRAVVLKFTYWLNL
ncbi:MAG: DUF5916 domain-containing protein [Cyclobacteriaceae bacterium]